MTDLTLPEGGRQDYWKGIMYHYVVHAICRYPAGKYDEK